MTEDQCKTPDCAILPMHHSRNDRSIVSWMCHTPHLRWTAG